MIEYRIEEYVDPEEEFYEKKYRLRIADQEFELMKKIHEKHEYWELGHNHLDLIFTEMNREEAIEYLQKLIKGLSLILTILQVMPQNIFELGKLIRGEKQ